jgi:septal ring factor EnvC (AmiA/AmiB activator)
VERLICKEVVLCMRQYYHGLAAIRGLLVLSCCVLLFSAQGTCSASKQAASPQVVTLSQAQYSELLSLTDKQAQLLTQLQQQLVMLTGNSTEQQQLLTTLQGQLQQSKIELVAARQDLQRARNSLSSAQSLIAEQNQSLAQLSAQIKAERRKARLQQIRTGLWSVVAGVALDRAYQHSR